MYSLTLDRWSLTLALAPTETVIVTLTGNEQLVPTRALFCVRVAVGRHQFSSTWES